MQRKHEKKVGFQITTHRSCQLTSLIQFLINAMMLLLGVILATGLYAACVYAAKGVSSGLKWLSSKYFKNKNLDKDPSLSVENFLPADMTKIIGTVK